jgi:hypothetical protein
MTRIILSIWLTALALTACSSTNTLLEDASSSRSANSSSEKLSRVLNKLLTGEGNLSFAQKSQELAIVTTERGVLLDVNAMNMNGVDVGTVQHDDISMIASSVKYQRLSMYVRSYTALKFLVEKNFIRHISIEKGK